MARASSTARRSSAIARRTRQSGVETETYAALRLEIENWRWAGAVLYARGQAAGEARDRDQHPVQAAAAAALQPHASGNGPCAEIQPNVLTMRIQPDEGIALRFGAKVPTTPNMSSLPGEHGLQLCGGIRHIVRERLRAAAAGCDAGRRDAVCASRRRGGDLGAYTPILEAWAAKNPEVFPNYFAGTWGPDCADRLLERDGHAWRNELHGKG